MPNKLTFIQDKLLMQRKHCFFKQAKGDRFIPARPTSSIEYELQQAKLEGVFDKNPPTHDQDGTCRAAFGRSYKQISQSRILGFSLPENCDPVPVVQRTPYIINEVKCLDAPDLSDNYYLNPICWATPTTIYVGLGSDLYSYNTHSLQSQKIIAGSGHSDVYALAYNSGILARSGSENTIQFLDTETNIQTGHIYGERVISISSDDYQGFYYLRQHDYTLSHFDVRSGRITCSTDTINYPVGLAFNPSDHTIAVSTDPVIRLYDQRRPSTPRLEYDNHISPSKSLAFSGKIMVSGGGNTDKSIQVWSTITGKLIASAQSNNQICGIHWLDPKGFFVTEGYSSNQVSCWILNETKIYEETKESAHAARVLFSAQNPENKEEIVTGSPDETLRFWSVENTNKSKIRIIPEAPDTLFNSATIR